MNLDEIREQKLKEMQTKQDEQEKAEQEIAVLDNNAKQFLSKDALIRYGNLKSAFPEKSVQLATIISRLVYQGHIKDKISDEQFKEMIISLTPKKKNINIIRK
jgi:DNA-binding TFAR19-related protein (PDSD5 family)